MIKTHDRACLNFFFFFFFSVRSNFISPNEHQKQNTSFGVHEIRSYTDKNITFSVPFMLSFTIINLLPTRRLSRGGGGGGGLEFSNQ